MSILLTNAVFVELHPGSVRGGELRIANGVIDAVAEQIPVQPSDEVVDCQGAVVMPGLVNGHTHLYSALATGMPAPPQVPRDFHEILKFIWWRLDRAHDQASIQASGQIGALAALRCGTTTLIDHHASPNAIDGSLDALRAGMQQVGVRGVLCYETTNRNRADEAEQGLAENERFIKKCQAAKDSRFAGMVGAHASFTLSDDDLANCVDLARGLGCGVHIHAAEDPVDERLTRELYGCGLIERFTKCGLLETARSIMAHGTHFSDADLVAINEHDRYLTLAHNPNSNMNNGVGYAPVAKLKKAPLLGTDGIGADMWREARTAFFKSNDARLSVGYERPLQMLAQSASLASDYLGISLGNLRPGSAADIVVTSYQPATPLSADNLAGHLIFGMGAEFVRHVLIGGEWCLRDGVVITCDESRLRANALGIAENLYARMD